MTSTDGIYLNTLSLLYYCTLDYRRGVTCAEFSERYPAYSIGTAKYHLHRLADLGLLDCESTKNSKSRPMFRYRLNSLGLQALENQCLPSR